MSVRTDLTKRIAELTDGDLWQLGDLLVDEFPPNQFGDVGDKTNTGLHDELRQHEVILARDYGILTSAAHLAAIRSTALAWPDSARAPSASFAVHLRIRGENRQAEMKKRLGQAKREGRALSVKMLSRFRYEDNPTQPRQYDERMRRAIAAAVRREMLGGIITKRADWWHATSIGQSDRDVAVRELRALASAISKPADGD